MPRIVYRQKAAELKIVKKSTESSFSGGVVGTQTKFRHTRPPLKAFMMCSGRARVGLGARRSSRTGAAGRSQACALPLPKGGGGVFVKERARHERGGRAHLRVVKSLNHRLSPLNTCVREGADFGRVRVAPLAPVERLVKSHNRARLAKVDESVADVRLRAEIAREVEEICDARGKRAREEPALRARLARAAPRAPYSF